MKEYLVTYVYRKKEYNCDDRDYVSSRIYDIDSDTYMAESKREVYEMCRNRYNRCDENYAIINIIELEEEEDEN